LVIACVPGLWLVRRRPRRAALVWVLCFVGYFLVAWAAGPGFNPWRAPFTFTPLIVLAGALGLDLLLAQVHGWVDRAEDVRARAWLASAGILGLCAIFLGGLGVFGVPCAAGKLPLRRDLTHLDQMLGGEAVASNVPWYVIAYTDSPAVSVPYNGEGAMAAVFERYRPRWLVVIGDPPLWVKGESRSLLEDVLSSRRATIGRFRLERVSASTTAAAVFRIEPG
jgi:hypothetical protein